MTEALQDAAVLWAGLHGIVSLRWNKPGYPWPPAETLIDRLLERFHLL